MLSTYVEHEKQYMYYTERDRVHTNRRSPVLAIFLIQLNGADIKTAGMAGCANPGHRPSR